MSLDDKIKPGQIFTEDQLIELGLVREPKLTIQYQMAMRETHSHFHGNVFRDKDDTYYFCDRVGQHIIPRNIVKQENETEMDILARDAIKYCGWQ